MFIKLKSLRLKSHWFYKPCRCGLEYVDNIPWEGKDITFNKGMSGKNMKHKHTLWVKYFIHNWIGTDMNKELIISNIRAKDSTLKCIVRKYSKLNLTGSLASWVECSPMVQETRVQSQVESYQRLKKKWYLLPLYKICIKGKVEQSRERGSTLPYTSV